MENTRLARCDVRGSLNDLMEKLAGDNGDIWLCALNKMLRKEIPWPNFPTWKIIKLGTHSAKALRKAMGNYQIGNWANDILQKVKVNPTETKVELVVVSVAELGFKNGATTKDIYQRAQELGLSLCPAEVGPQLRRQYKDQPKGEWLLIAMEPITVSDGGLSVFHVGCSGGALWLFGNCGRPGCFWLGGHRWVFVRRK